MDIRTPSSEGLSVDEILNVAFDMALEESAATSVYIFEMSLTERLISFDEMQALRDIVLSGRPFAD